MKKLKLVAVVLPIAAALLGSPLRARSGQFVTPSAGHGPATLPDHRLVQKMQVFTANGTWTRPANVDVVHVTLVGGGGAGGTGAPVGSSRSGDGGDGGQTVFKRPYPVTGNVSVVVGHGGDTAGASDAQKNGGDSSCGTLVAKGGISGSSMGRRLPSGADCRVSSLGDSGGGGGSTYAAEGGGSCGYHWGGRKIGSNSCYGRGGGASSMGDGGDGETRSNNVTVAATAGTGYGAGGGGGRCGGGTGANGAGGIVIVEWWEWIVIQVPLFPTTTPYP